MLNLSTHLAFKKFSKGVGELENSFRANRKATDECLVALRKLRIKLEQLNKGA